MTDRPILFSGPMVRALLDGSKTQTRRALKVQPWDVSTVASGNHIFDFRADKADLEKVLDMAAMIKRCPYGQPGDRLWVRETWQGPLLEEFESDADGAWMSPSRIHQYQNAAHCRYAADGGPAPEFMDSDDNLQCRWRPGIHMFRWASRITLEVTGVRVERLQDITRGDAMAEGCPFPNLAQGDDPRHWYTQLWETINGPGSWDANPWVWVIEFKKRAAIGEAFDAAIAQEVNHG